MTPSLFRPTLNQPFGFNPIAAAGTAGYTKPMNRWLLLALLSLAPAAWGAQTREEREFADLVKRMRSGDLPTIQFELDSDEILEDSFTTIDAIAELLLANPRLKLIVLAHTCTLGGEEYNLELSQRRAKSVKSALVKRGVPPPSIRYRGLGLSMPVADNDTEEGRAKNRRVEFRVTTREWSSVY